MFKRITTSKIQSTSTKEKPKGAKMAKKEASEAKDPPPPTETSATPTAAVAITGNKLPVLATPTDFSALQAAVEKAKQDLANLEGEFTDPALKSTVRNLLELANPQKLGVTDDLTARWTLPRLQLCQAGTTVNEKPAEARPGDLFTRSGELLKRPYEFVAIHISQGNVMFAAGSGQNQPPECAAPDAKLGSPYGLCDKCPHQPMGQQNGGKGKQQKTRCNNQIKAVITNTDFDRLYEVNFAKTSRQAGGALVTLVRRSKYAWERSYLLDSETDKNDNGQVYQKFKLTPTGKAISAEHEKIARAMYYFVDANHKLFLADYYDRIARGAFVARQVEEDSGIDSELMAGLNQNSDGIEPTDEPAGKTGSVRGGAAPM